MVVTQRDCRVDVAVNSSHHQQGQERDFELAYTWMIQEARSELMTLVLQPVVMRC